MTNFTTGLSTLVIFFALWFDFSVDGVKIYKSRKKAMSLLSGVTKDSQHYFSSCEQSSNMESCQMAMDEGFSQEWSQCSSTYPQTSAWWRGYLDNPMYVSTVYILNADWLRVGETDALLEFTISGNGHVCYTHRDTESFSSKTFPCDILADDIEIRSSIADAMLSLCEVQVFGAELKIADVLGYPTALTYESCTQSSTELSRYCWNGFDGWRGQDANKGECAMTHAGNYEWWSAILELPALVQRVMVYNRIDCCKEQLTNFEITVGSRRCFRYNTPDTFETKQFFCNQFGGDVKIQNMGAGTLTLCEVMVFGHVVQMLPEQNRKFIGCFNDKPGDPDLSDFKEPMSLTQMSVNKCDRICRRLKAKYFGLQGGMQCWCGNSYGNHGQVNNTDCGMECEGKRKQYCGNIFKNLIYELL